MNEQMFPKNACNSLVELRMMFKLFLYVNFCLPFSDTLADRYIVWAPWASLNTSEEFPPLSTLTDSKFLYILIS